MLIIIFSAPWSWAEPFCLYLAVDKHCQILFSVALFCGRSTLGKKCVYYVGRMQIEKSSKGNLCSLLLHRSVVQEKCFITFGSQELVPILPRFPGMDILLL